MSLNSSLVNVDDICYESTVENKSLLKDLLFATNCVNVLKKFKTFVELVFHNYRIDFNVNDLQEYKQLNQEVEDVFKQYKDNQLVQNIPETNDRLMGSLISDQLVAEQPSTSLKQPIPPDVNEYPKPKINKKVLFKCIINGCQYQTCVNQNIELHIYEKHKTLTKKFKCDFCSKRYFIDYSVKTHMKAEHPKQFEEQLAKPQPKVEKTPPVFKCNIIGCNQTFVSNEMLGIHIMGKHSSSSSTSGKYMTTYKCYFDGCFYATYKKQTYVRHVNKHKQTEPLVCEHQSCGKQFLSDHSLREHTKLIHQKIRRFKCDFDGCDYESGYYQSLISHTNIEHKRIRPFQCTHCESTFGSQVTLRKHIKLMHVLITNPVQCQYPGCNKTFKTETTLKVHNRIMHLNIKPEKKFRCDHPACEYRAQTKSQVFEHKGNVHSDERPFGCTFAGCARKFKTEKCLNKHSLTHSGQTFQCDECDRTFNNRKTLRVHKEIHANQVMPCDWPGCPYQTNQTILLRNHKKVHTKTADIPCDWPECHRMFKCRKYLNEHMKKHTNDKPHACDWPGCQYRTCYSGNIGKHRKTHEK